MRTTLTLDPDVSALIEQELRDRQTSLKSVINDRLRRAYSMRNEPVSYDLPAPLDLGQPLLGNFDDIAAVLDLIENDPA